MKQIAAMRNCLVMSHTWRNGDDHRLDERYALGSLVLARTVCLGRSAITAQSGFDYDGRMEQG